MRFHRLILAGSLVVAGSLAAQEVPIEWKTVKAAPAWVAKPPQAAGKYRYATERRSNLRRLARERAISLGERDGLQHLTEHLTPSLGRPLAIQLATAAVAQREPVAFAEKFERLKDARGPGNTLASNWVMWQISIEDALAAVPVALRGRAERAFLRPPPPWEDVEKAPEWLEKIPERQGWSRFVLKHTGEFPGDAHTQAVVMARPDLEAKLTKHLARSIPESEARKAAAAAVTDMHAVHRASWFRRGPKVGGRKSYLTTTWILWEVPVWRIQRAVAKEHQAAVVAPSGSGPKIVKAGHYVDGSTHGVVRLAGGGEVSFHLDVTKSHCQLFEGATYKTDSGARLVAVGSEREQVILAGLDAALRHSFDAAQRAAIVARPRFGHDRKKMTWQKYLEGQVLRDVHRYRRLTGARITTIIEGKGTVRLSLKVEDGAAKPRLFTFREIDGKVRLHAADQADPIALNSSDEVRVKLAIDVWLRYEAKGGKDAKAAALAQVAQDYRRSTTPRLQRMAFLLDGGSVTFSLTDRAEQPVEVRFDRQLRSKTPGRMYVSWRGDQGLVELGSEREARLLKLLDAAVVLAAEMPERAQDAKGLADSLAGYRAKFKDR